MSTHQCQVTQKRATEHSASQWENQRTTFTDLYVTKNLKLSEVREIMRTQHGFDATERQYKRKIVVWKLEKNIKAKDKSAMIRQRDERMSQHGKKSRFFLNGKQVKDDKLDRFLRMGYTVKSPDTVRPPTPRNILCRTPGSNKGVSDVDVEERYQIRSSSVMDLIIDSSSSSIELAMDALHEIPSFQPNEQLTDDAFLALAKAPQACQRAFGQDNDPNDMAKAFAMYLSVIWLKPWSAIAFTDGRTPGNCDALDVGRIINFSNWSHIILMTTKTPYSIILLALLIIYRFKEFNSDLIGAPGSEYRVATAALMIANKFSEDHCYTNKTWAAVSGIPVEEIHVMEVEFLSNMRYNLYVSDAEWTDWVMEFDKYSQMLEQACELDPMVLRPAQAPEGNIVLSRSKTYWDTILSQPNLERDASPPDSGFEIMDMPPPPGPKPATTIVYGRGTPLTPRARSPLTFLSPSMFFSPQANCEWPSFDERPNGLYQSTLRDDAGEILASELPSSELHWRPLRGRGTVETGTIPIDDGLWSPTMGQDWSPVW